MAAKLVLSMDGAVLQEYALAKERMTIGRKPHNDIVIDNLAVSGEHAAIVTILNDSFLEDLDSTNGVMVNGAAVKKHFLQNNDLIEIGKYKLRYLNMQQSQAAEQYEKTVVLRAPTKAAPAAAATPAAHEATGKFQPEAARPNIPPATAPAPAVQAEAAKPAPARAEGSATVATPQAQAGGVPLAAVQILSGPNAGKELELVKNLTTLGKPGVQVVVVTRRPHGYFITHVEGANFPSLNGKILDAHQHPLNNHDIIDLAGVKMEFFFKE